jgi:SAM-dependent methyltransferase
MDGMEDENGGTFRLGSALRPLLTYGIPIVGAGVWAFAKFPERLRWTSDIQARVFGLAAAFYEDLTHVEGYGEALDAAIDALETPPTRVLDLGCGTGYAARRIQEAFPDAEVVGVDLSPEMVLIARTEADNAGFDIVFEVGDAADLEFEDESFDLVVSHNAPPFPAETMRVLRPAGTALTVWSFGGPWVGLAWPALAKEFKKANVLYADGFRSGPGFYGLAEKSGIRRRRRPRADESRSGRRPATGASSRTPARPFRMQTPGPARSGSADRPAPRVAPGPRVTQAPKAAAPARPRAQSPGATRGTRKPATRTPKDGKAGPKSSDSAS